MFGRKTLKYRIHIGKDILTEEINYVALLKSTSEGWRKVDSIEASLVREQLKEIYLEIAKEAVKRWRKHLTYFGLDFTLHSEYERYSSPHWIDKWYMMPISISNDIIKDLGYQEKIDAIMKEIEDKEHKRT